MYTLISPDYAFDETFYDFEWCVYPKDGAEYYRLPPSTTGAGSGGESDVISTHSGNETVLSTLSIAAAATPSPGILSSYASLVNPDEGSSLNFVQTPVIDGVKCAKIEINDVIPEIEYWQSAILCSVLGANPPLKVIEGYLRRIWKYLDIDKICLVRKGVYLLRFNSLADQLVAVQRGVYYFDNKPLLVKPCNQEMDINTKPSPHFPSRSDSST
ncbi:hypothetical protein Cgig2_012934 [Carnegiea gigantea]|uniref:DUF4283 domain-containing protein n=1 Tax=Carnegiea gigantea TaxID=171969 RepID=A0A9Q1GIX2_9CARY|nr:hypothetical protein Cgig2_012934 [Carnegiea gigantea]